MLNTLNDSAAQPNARPEQSEDLQKYLTLREIIGVLWGYKLSIAVYVAIPLAIAIGYLSVTPKTYTARAQLLLDPRTPQPLSQNENTTVQSWENAYIESQVALLRSEKIALSVVNSLNLLNDGELTKGLTIPRNAEKLRLEDDFLLSRHVMEAFNSNVDVRRSGMSYAIDISYSSRDPDKVAKVTNAIAEAFVADQLDAHRTAVRRGSDWLEDRIEQLRKEMNIAALKVQQFRVKRDYRIVPQGGQHGDSFAAAVPSGAKGSDSANDEQRPNMETLEELESTAQTYRRIYESYLQAYTESVQRQSLPTTNARIITPATRPLVPSAPKMKLILAFALLLGLLLGVGQALLRHHFRPYNVAID